MGRLAMVLAGCVTVVLLLSAQLRADNEPVVKSWGNYLVVTAPDEGTSGRDLAAREQLSQRTVTFTFKETPFSEAVEFLQNLTGLNFVVDRNAGVDAVNITLSLKQVSARTALEFLTRQAGLTWTVRDGVVLIGNKENLVGPMRTGVYDVTDLLAVPPDFPGPSMNLQTGLNQKQTGFDPWNPVTPPGPEKQPTGAEKTRAELMQNLVDIVGGMLQAGTWDNSNFP